MAKVFVHKLIWDELYGADRTISTEATQNKLLHTISRLFTVNGEPGPLAFEKILFIGDMDDTGLSSSGSLILEYNTASQQFEARSAISEILNVQDFHVIDQDGQIPARRVIENLTNVLEDIRKKPLSAATDDALVLTRYIDAFITDSFGDVKESVTSSTARLAEILSQDVHQDITSLVMTANGLEVTRQAIEGEPVTKMYKDIVGFHDAIRMGHIKQSGITTPMRGFEFEFSGDFRIPGDNLQDLLIHTINPDEEQRLHRVLNTALITKNLNDPIAINEVIDEILPILGHDDTVALNKFTWHIARIGDKGGGEVADLYTNIRREMQRRMQYNLDTSGNVIDRVTLFQGDPHTTMSLPLQETGRRIGAPPSQGSQLTLAKYKSVIAEGGEGISNIKKYAGATRQSLRDIARGVKRLQKAGTGWGVVIDTETLVSSRMNQLLTGDESGKFMTELSGGGIRGITSEQRLEMKSHYSDALDQLGRYIGDDKYYTMGKDELTESMADVWQYLGGLNEADYGERLTGQTDVRKMNLSEIQSYIVAGGKTDDMTDVMIHRFQTSNPQEQMAYFRAFAQSTSTNESDITRVVNRLKTITGHTLNIMQTEGLEPVQLMMNVFDQLGGEAMDDQWIIGATLDITSIRGILNQISDTNTPLTDIQRIAFRKLDKYLQKPNLMDPAAMIKILQASGLEGVPTEGASIQAIAEFMHTQPGMGFDMSNVFVRAGTITERHRATADAALTEDIIRAFRGYFGDDKVDAFMKGFAEVDINKMVNADMFLVPDYVIQGTASEMQDIYGISVDQVIRDNKMARMPTIAPLGSKEIYQITDVGYPDDKIGITFTNIHSDDSRYLEFNSPEQMNRFVGAHNIHEGVNTTQAQREFADMPLLKGMENADRRLREIYTGNLRGSGRITNVADVVDKELLGIPSFLKGEEFQGFIGAISSGADISADEVQAMNMRLVSELSDTGISIDRGYYFGKMFSEEPTLRGVVAASPHGTVPAGLSMLANIGERVRLKNIAMPTRMVSTTDVREIVRAIIPSRLDTTIADQILEQIAPSERNYMELSRHASGAATHREALQSRVMGQLKKFANNDMHGLNMDDIDPMTASLSKRLDTMGDMGSFTGDIVADSQFVNTNIDDVRRNTAFIMTGMELADDKSLRDSELRGVARVIRDVSKNRSHSLISEADEPGVELYTKYKLPEEMSNMTPDDFDQFSRIRSFSGNDVARGAIYTESGRRAGLDINRMNIITPSILHNFADSTTMASTALSKFGPTGAILGLSMVAGGAVIGQAFYDRMPSRSMMGADGYLDPDGMFVSTPPGFPNIVTNIISDRATGLEDGYDININNVEGHGQAANIISRIKNTYGSAEIQRGSYRKITDDDIKAVLDRMV